MKTRLGLISNSSTTSFTCIICGQVEAYSDCSSMADMGGIMCSRGHAMHEACLEMVKVKPDRTEVDDDDGYHLHIDDCPICQLKILSLKNEVLFLRSKHSVSNQQTLDEIKNTYGDYVSFVKSIKG